MSRSPQAIATALTHLHANQHEQAKAVLRRVVQKDPRDAEANKLLAMLHAGLDEYEQALFYIRRAVDAAPNDPLLAFIHGNILMVLKKDAQAAEAYRRCTTLAPGYFDGYDGLAKCLLRLGRHDEAVAAYEGGVAVAPDDPATYRAYAGTLSTMSRVPEALAVLRRGIERLPRDAGLRESLCYQSNFADDMDAATVFAEHAALGRAFHDERAGGAAPSLPNTPDPERQLRIGFISGDFCTHACATFMEGLIAAMDRERYEPFCYYVRAEVDEPTRRFAAMSQWRACHAMDIESLRAQIIADGIDVLIDTAGWTEHHRLGAFVPRAAPLQMTWLGYPNTTGLAAMDYRIVDAITDPPGAEQFCTERLLRLEGCFVCYTPPANAPQVQLTPALATPDSHHPITFGSFNRLSKVRPQVAALWAGVLARVPGSRLFLKSSLVSEDVKALYNAIFAAGGITPDRILWSSYVPGMDQHLAAYQQVDIALDSFPYNGTTTTCEATWMGVPVVTLRGDVHRARVGASLLTALGLESQIAASEEDYVEIAAGLAGDRAALAHQHQSLRGTMAASPLCDSTGYARRFETGLRSAWQEWCRGRSA